MSEIQAVTLQTQHFDAIILLLGREGKLLAAQKYFDIMSTYDLQPTLATFCSLMTGYAKLGLFSEAFQLLERMKFDGVKPNEVPYNILIHACASSKGEIPVAKVSLLTTLFEEKNVLFSNLFVSRPYLYLRK